MNTCLLLIDLQNDYFEGGANPLNGSLPAVQNAKKILQHFRSKNCLICHVQHISVKSGATFFKPDTRGCEIHEMVKPAAGEPVIIKNFPNSFRKTELLNFLSKSNVDNLVIAGMMTHMCVDATTRAAVDLGFKCSVIYDACATKDLQINGATVLSTDVHNSFMAAFQGTYAEILMTEKILSA